jgi:predicted metal-dependent phosphoesterase TrpH
LIDLHLHTTASDGMLAPGALVEAAARAGLATIAVTDHDTVAGLAEARRAAEAHGLTLVDGIEVTAVEGGRDVHVLAYFFDQADPALNDFLAAQRADRVRRVNEMTVRLAAAGVPIDAEPIVRLASSGGSVGRPHVAAALVAAGHVATVDDAFDRYLGHSCPAFVPRLGAPAADVVRTVAAAGGICSLAHPGTTRMDALIPGLAAAGLAALEAAHPDHDAGTEQKYRAMAAQLGLAVSGGSDFHGEGRHHRSALGAVCLGPADFQGLLDRRP